MTAIASPAGVHIDFGEATDPGRDPEKLVNEDASGFALTPFGHLALVCDGMGGHSDGQRASRTAVISILEAVRACEPSLGASAALRAAIERANRAVYALGGAHPNEVRPGSTCVVALVTARELCVAHVGDSRLYLIRGAAVQRLTRDHSLVEDMVKRGVLASQEAAHHPEANKITRALGIEPDVQVEQTTATLFAGDILLLTSDGLTDVVSDAEIAELARADQDPSAACNELVRLANARGGYDNITVQILRVLELPTKEHAAPPTLTDVSQAPAGPKTLLDAGPSVAAKLLDARSQHLGTRATVPDPAAHGHPEPAPTLVQERLTEPAVEIDRVRATGALAQSRAARKASLLVAVSAILAALVVAAVCVWWLLAAIRKSGNTDDTPPPEPRSPSERQHVQ